MHRLNRRRFLERASGVVAGLATGLTAARGQSAPGLVFYDPATLRHQPAADHPESPKRIDAVMSAVRVLEREGHVSVAAPRPATEDDVLLVHSPRILEEGSRTRSRQGAGRSAPAIRKFRPDRSTPRWPQPARWCRRVDAVMGGSARNAFCALRPPGHHASASRGMGFCVFNNIAIGARYAARRHGVDRILIADWDVHHGNGTQDVFWNDGSVLFFDTHQHPWYPGTGSPEETGEGKAAA